MQKLQDMVEKVLGEAIALPQIIWRRLNLLWVVNFAAIGALNLYVVYTFSEPTWVKFKFYGLIPLTLLMALVTGIYVSRHVTEAPAKEP